MTFFLILRLSLIYLFFLELRLIEFKNKKSKWIWFFLVLVFGYFGYAFYLAFRRKLVVKRKFQPKFNLR